MLAEVTDNADPENLGRVQVQFAWQKSRNKTTNWIRVRSLDAGSSETVSKNRGFVFVPEIGDQVMVDFELGDPCRPYVSGSMFHRNNGKGGNADNHIKTIVTRSGHTIEFDDSEDSTWGFTIKDKEKNADKLAEDFINATSDTKDILKLLYIEILKLSKIRDRKILFIKRANPFIFVGLISAIAQIVTLYKYSGFLLGVSIVFLLIYLVYIFCKRFLNAV
jgi:hypothetical protein